jgi:hypothetical protein
MQESCLLPLALKQELKEMEVQMFLFGFCNKKLFKIASEGKKKANISQLKVETLVALICKLN